MSRKKELVFEKDEIVIGGDLRALIYSYFHEIPVIYSSLHPPLRFDKFDKFLDPTLGVLGFPEGQICTPRQVWERLVFLLGISGLMPINNLENTLRVAENRLTVSTGTKLINFKFNKLVIYEDKGIAGLTRVSEEKRKKNRVVDWINVRSGCRHDHLYLEDDDDFVKEIYFYPTERSDNKKLKDLAAVSYLTDEQLKDFNFSDTMAKFKIKKMMKEAGIRGARNGRDVKNPEKYKYYAVKVEPAEREVWPDVVRYYEPDERFEFRYDTVEELLVQSGKPQGYLSKLCEVI